MVLPRVFCSVQSHTHRTFCTTVRAIWSSNALNVFNFSLQVLSTWVTCPRKANRKMRVKEWVSEWDRVKERDRDRVRWKKSSWPNWNWRKSFFEQQDEWRCDIEVESEPRMRENMSTNFRLDSDVLLFLVRLMNYSRHRQHCLWPTFEPISSYFLYPYIEMDCCCSELAVRHNQNQNEFVYMFGYEYV